MSANSRQLRVPAEEIMDISSRKKKILAAVIEEYIRTAEPVGSKAIAASADLGCSSATIRNELAELVAMGYLEQPHTSAGRVPTPLGYRMYVNELMEHKDLTAEETQAITQSLTGRHQRGELMTDASRLASQLTNYPAVTLTTSAGVTIRRFDLIYLDANSFIIVLLLSDDTVKNKLVHLPVSGRRAHDPETRHRLQRPLHRHPRERHHPGADPLGGARRAG